MRELLFIISTIGIMAACLFAWGTEKSQGIIMGVNDHTEPIIVYTSPHVEEEVKYKLTAKDKELVVIEGDKFEFKGDPKEAFKVLWGLYQNCQHPPKANWWNGQFNSIPLDSHISK